LKIRGVKGVQDIFPEEVWKWELVESVAKKTFEEHGFFNIRIPVFEYTDLFARSIGGETDIVEKEMYTFQDSKGVNISLRPEGTAGVIRALVEHHRLAPSTVSKLYYLGPMFRHERPQKGRYRQFHQIGAEVLGTDNPMADAELLSMVYLFFQRLGITDTVLEINSLGCRTCRPLYRRELKSFLEKRSPTLCGDCRRRSVGNPLRVLDCKVPGCRESTADAPVLLGFLCRDCMAHFEEVQRVLNDLRIPFVINERLVRGLDYYTRTAFEMVTGKLGSQNAVAAGGRYDGLVEEIGGPPTPGIGFAVGLERITALLPEGTSRPVPPLLYLAALGPEALKRIPLLLHQLRSRGIRAETNYQGKSLKSQMKKADKAGASLVGILGEEELNRGTILLRDMKNKDQVEINLDRFVDTIEKRWESSQER